ncbi:MAG: sodium:proton antiporter [Verrucomicrobia bacterium]|nr:sodium:proton antiporter [Verrucomicrobiota bacterium]
MFSLSLATLEAVPSPWMVLPFCLLLLLIAAGPLAMPHFWEKYYAHSAVGLGLSTAACYLFVLHRAEPLLHSAHEYFSFISLVGSLYVVSGGILIRVKGEATPAVNCLFLFVGALLANLLGTTGASMLLIRPWIRMNKYRITEFHVVFFILLVSNVGGALTPIGDPPLFLGFLKGVPFWWMLRQCWEPWLFAIFLFLGVFYFLDRRNFARAPEAVREAETREEHWKMDGLINVPLVAMLLGAVLLLPVGWREAAMLAAAAASWFVTPKRVHEENHFDFAPLKEVAWLFIGIFLTMLPALELLGANAGALGLQSSLQFYWFTGILSGLLDNAPTYLAFLAAAFGANGLSLESDMAAFLASHAEVLKAISLGAVFFGAMTYIGNGPNLMVKKIADQQNVRTPSFLGYVLRYSLPVFVPVFWLLGMWLFSK